MEEINQNPENIVEENKKIIPPEAIFRCQQCRTILFTGSSIISHEATKTRKFANKRKEYGDKSNECTSYFIEQPSWLNAIGKMSDTIYCPKCNFKIGHFSWKGAQCSCGEWIKPSFQIPISRVDSI